MTTVVADTNVLISALQFGGKPKQLLDWRSMASCRAQLRQSLQLEERLAAVNARPK